MIELSHTNARSLDLNLFILSQLFDLYKPIIYIFLNIYIFSSKVCLLYY